MSKADGLVPLGTSRPLEEHALELPYGRQVRLGVHSYPLFFIVKEWTCWV